MSAARKLEKVQLASSIYDYIAAGVFAFPIIAAWYLSNTLHDTHIMMGAEGSYPKFEDFHVLFANFFGGFAIMWSTLRIVKRTPVLGMCDGFLRLYFASIMTLYLFMFNTSLVLSIFIVVELFWGSWQLFLYFSARRDLEFKGVEQFS